MAFLEHPKRNVTTKMTHLARDPLYLKQKPYGVDFATDTPTTNHVFEDVEVTIRDARSIKSGFSLDENGFCFLDHSTSAIFDSLKTDPSKVEDYYKEIETLIKFAFPEYSRFDIIDHLLRRRDLGYPGNVTAETKIAQPARLPHSDFSLDGLFLRMKRACPGQESLYSEKEYEIVK
ncbi:hypothetical protein LTS15_003494 [Exophiala xenobiotica]|nr:hypothetical protein LTS15_003494 [Exophiala xenobiotica]